MPDTSRQTRPAEVCPHGIALSKFCAELHAPGVNVVVPQVGVGTCPHGITLDKFCTQLHTP